MCWRGIGRGTFSLNMHMYKLNGWGETTKLSEPTVCVFQNVEVQRAGWTAIPFIPQNPKAETFQESKETPKTLNP